MTRTAAPPTAAGSLRCYAPRPVSTPRFLNASREHFEVWARLFRELGVDDPLPSVDVWLSTQGPDTFFAEFDGEFVGYGYGQVLGASGYVRNVVVAPTVRGRGLGRAIVLELGRRMAAAGCTSWQLNVKVDNTPAIELYRSVGMQADYRTWVVRIPLDATLALAPSPAAVSAREPRAEFDAPLERDFEVAPGLLARHRTRPGARVLVFELEGRPIALAPFDPHFPGCFPFRLRDPRAAADVIARLVELVPAGRPHLQLVIERDEFAVRTLLAAGARAVFEIQHMSGTLA